MTVQIWQGALAPNAYVLVVPDAVAPEVNLADVSSAVFMVRDPLNTEHQWPASHHYVDGKLVVTFMFGDTTSEISGPPGKWTAFAKLTLAGGGTVRTDTEVIDVLPAYGLRTK